MDRNPNTAKVDKRETAAFEIEKMQINRKELVERIARAVPENGVVQTLEGLFMARASSPLGLIHGVVKPCFCVVAQGSKEFLLGESRYRYDPDHYLITTLEMPSTTQILEATPEQPYFSLRMDLDPAFVGSVIEEAGLGSVPGSAAAK